MCFISLFLLVYLFVSLVCFFWIVCFMCLFLLFYLFQVCFIFFMYLVCFMCLIRVLVSFGMFLLCVCVFVSCVCFFWLFACFEFLFSFLFFFNFLNVTNTYSNNEQAKKVQKCITIIYLLTINFLELEL